MKPGDTLRLHFDDEEDMGVRPIVISPEHVKLPILFSDVQEAKQWMSDLVLPELDKVLQEEGEMPMEKALKRAIGRVLTAKKES